MLALYGSGNPRAHYVADFTKATTDAKGKLVPAYECIPQPATLKDFEAHLAGTRGLLNIPVDDQGTTSCGTIDVDEYNQYSAKDIIDRLHTHYLPLVPVRSKSGGWHLNWHLKHPRAATLVRERLEHWAKLMGLRRYEIFPKQDRLNGEVGNGINLPYFGGDAQDTKNFAVNSAGERMTLEAWLAVAEAAPDWSDDAPPVDAVAVLSRHWKDGTRNNISNPLCGFLMRHGKDRAYCEALLDAVAAQTGVGRDRANRGVPAKVERDLARDDKHVRGYPSLQQQIGAADAATVAAACGIVLPPPQQEEEPDNWLSVTQLWSDFIKLDIPPREPIFEGLLFTEQLVTMYAWRGTGKTFLVMQFCVDAARGTGTFFKWPVHRAREVLLIDGEMSGAELQERARMFPGVEAMTNLHAISSHVFYQTFRKSMNLANPVHQQCLLKLLDDLEAAGHKIEVLVLDNKSALTRGTVENATEGQEALVDFLIHLRHRGLTVVLVHHAGKGGTQRGASSLEDPIDLVIKLEEPKDAAPSAEGNALFNMSFEKHRSLRKPKPYVLQVELLTDPHGRFTWGMSEPADKRSDKSKLVRVLEYLYDHPGTAKQADIARALGIDRSDLSKVIKEARVGRGKGSFLDGDSLDLTDSARRYVETVREREDAAPGEPDQDGGAPF